MGDSFEKNYPMDQFPDDYDLKTAGSSMDCTGLIPSAIQDEGELESYEEMYDFYPRITSEYESEDR